MKYLKKYIVYELNVVNDDARNLCLEKTLFPPDVTNSFDSEGEAVQALEDTGRVLGDYLILPQFKILS